MVYWRVQPFLCACLLACWVSSSSPVWAARLAESPKLWPSLGMVLPLPRWWESLLLKRAVVVSNDEQLWPLLEKLDRREPITVVAFGSSVTGDYGGCFHAGQPGLDAITSRVGWLGETYTLDRCRQIVSSGPNATNHPETGWLAQFMGRINATWPHADHLLINLGSAGFTLAALNAALCLEHMIPKGVDLVILEQPSLEGANKAPNVSGAAVEEVMQRLWRLDNGRQQPPAVIMVNVMRIMDGPPDALRCISTLACQGEVCTSVDWRAALQYLMGPMSLGVAEADVHSTAAAYGVTSLSTLRFWASLIRDNASTHLNMTYCQMISSLQHDNIHPSGPLGRVFYADMLTAQLADAQRSWTAVRASQAGDTALLPRMWPEESIHKEGIVLWNMRCYGARLPSQEMDGTQAAASLHSVPAIDVVRNDGWELITHYVTNDGRRTHKPGWVGLQPGAVLQVRVNADFSMDGPAAPETGPWAPPPPATNTTTSIGNVGNDTTNTSPPSAVLVIGFLTSYEHMGRARVTCVSGCECNGEELEGHEATHRSITRVRWVPITQHPQCVFQLEVLQETSSGEHKFKLQTLVVRARVPGR